MIREIKESGPVRGRVRVPGSKSITNRALVCAALARGETLLANASDSDDSALMITALDQLGVLARRTDRGLLVRGSEGRLFAPRYPISVGNAGTTLRFLLSLAALAEGTTVLEGSERMANRPNDELLEALRAQGVSLRQNAARYEVGGTGLRGGELHLHAAKSSQFLSSLLLVAPYAKADMRIMVEGPLASESYVGMTCGIMQEFGVEVHGSAGRGYHVPAGRPYVSCTMAVEADASSASYPLAAAAITGGEIFVEGFCLSSLQGDAAIVDILRRMGCVVEERSGGMMARGPAVLRGIDLDMNRFPDLVPTVVSVALFADGLTRIRNVAHLRFKESDRLAALAEELRRLGARIEVTSDGLEVSPTVLHGARLDPHDDHRLAMSFAVIGLGVAGVVVENPDCVRKSYPEFWTEFHRMYL
jgi:3-phosphoshikimate 1-carboxyvinyltransferase